MASDEHACDKQNEQYTTLKGQRAEAPFIVRTQRKGLCSRSCF